MPKLIQKSKYFKSDGGGAGKYMAYIVTREGVELLDENTPQPDIYIKYIAERPRSHGLFSNDESVPLEDVRQEIENHQGPVWTFIYSLKREDAARLGYDSAASWKQLLTAHQVELAEAMKIPPQDFHWCAAFHDEGHHPHVHMMVWSTDPKQGYLTEVGIEKMRSKLTNQIFQDEMLSLFQRKDVSYKEVVEAAREAMGNLIRQMEGSICDSPVIAEKMETLAGMLSECKGKKVYGYLKKSAKELVDSIVDELAKLPEVAECYEVWNRLRDEVESYYKDKPRERLPLSQQNEFKTIKNMVVREAENIRIGTLTFEDEAMAGEDEPEQDYGVSVAFWELKQTIRDEALPLGERDAAVQQLEKLAESGDVDAQYLMGVLYRDGPLLVPDDEKAREWFEKAAEQEMTAAQYALGKLLLSKSTEVYDPEQGIKWLEAAAQNKNSYAAYRLGKEYLKGEVVKRDAVKAAEYLKQSAEAGNQYAQYTLGKLLITEANSQIDDDEPEQTAETPDMKWAAKMYRSAKADLYDERTTDEQKGLAVRMLEELWKIGFTPAAHQLGKCYRDGIGVSQDSEQAELWFRRSSEAGNEWSQYALGKLLQEQGRVDEAVKWFEKSAEQGNQYAEYQLGKLYLAEFGRYEDYELARYWFTQSANQGNEYAQFFLNHMDQARRPSILLAATYLLHHLGQIFRQNSVPPVNPASYHTDRKLLSRIREKKIAMGHKPDDHEDPVQEQGWGMSMM